jgi:DNA-binding response OmpR family regulator/HPt (histidine-containing phosphotransfer) domain-containing protein
MKILLVEDDSLAGELLITLLRNHCYIVDLAVDGKTGFDLAEQQDYDLILLDVLLPKLDGISVCRRLRGQGCETPILMLTSRDSGDDVITGLDAGADDYVIKPYDPAQLSARIRSLLRRGKQSFSSALLQWGDLSLNPVSTEVIYQNTKIFLTAKEYTLLEFFLRHPQQVFSRDALIDHLWSMNESPANGTVTNLIKDLRRKLKAAGLIQDVIETVYGLGYRLKVAPQERQWKREQEDKEVEPEETTHEQSIVERFRASLNERLAQIDAALQAFQMGALGVQQRQNAITEVHRLAGTLGMFGANQASERMKAIEHLLMLPEPAETQMTQVCQMRSELEQIRVSADFNLPTAVESDRFLTPAPQSRL